MGCFRIRERIFLIVTITQAACQTISVSGGDVRIAKAHVTRGNDIIRLSIIGNGTESVVPPLAYRAKFQKRWESKWLHSQLLNVSEVSRIVVDGKEFELKLPNAVKGTTGLLVADPCFTGRGGLGCPNGDRMHILDHLTEIINQLVGSDQFDYWGVLGDNLYDQKGEITSEFFQHISAAVKAKPFITVPGNHDFWISGGPVGLKADQLGYGFMQFYGQDTIAGVASTSPYDFSGNPDALEIAAGDNFMFITQIGDVAFFGYSAAHGWDVAEPVAEKFCNHVGNTESVNVGVILGHWNEQNLGCVAGMDVPSMYDKLKGMGGCKSKLLLYFDGHQHCNRVTLPSSGAWDAVGFMIGGTGMYGDCTPEFGFTVLQSLPHSQGGPNARVDYFMVAQDPSWGKDPNGVVDRFDEMLNCFRSNGYSRCRDQYGMAFRTAPPPPTLAPSPTGHAMFTTSTCVICALLIFCIVVAVVSFLWRRFKSRSRAGQPLIASA